MQRAVAATADVGLPAPVGELIAGGGGQQYLAGVGAVERGPRAGERVGVVGGEQAQVPDVGAEHGELAVEAPAAPARVDYIPAWREAQLAAVGARDHALVGGIVGVALEPQHEVDALDGERAGDDGCAHGVALGGMQGIDHGRTLGGADGDSRLDVRIGGTRPLGGAAGMGRAEHAELGQLVLQGDGVGDERLGVVGHGDHGVLGEERLDAPAGVHDARQLQVGLGDRLDLGVGPVLVRVPVVVR